MYDGYASYIIWGMIMRRIATFPSSTLSSTYLIHCYRFRPSLLICRCRRSRCSTHRCPPHNLHGISTPIPQRGTFIQYGMFPFRYNTFHNLACATHASHSAGMWIDREQLDYGLLLLERNVNCLLRVRNVPFRNEWNVLAKMEKLLLHIIEGGE